MRRLPEAQKHGKISMRFLLEDEFQVKHDAAVSPTEATFGYLRFLRERGLRPKTETVRLKDAVGRVLAEPVSWNGCMLMQRGAAMTPEAAVILAESGVCSVSAAARPRAVLVGTDALTDVLEGVVRALGARVRVASDAAKVDDVDLILVRAAEGAFDALVGTDGGFAPCVAVRPGGETRLGVCGSVPVIELPENGTDAVSAIGQFVRPVVEALLLTDGADTEHVCMTMGAPLASPEPIRTFVPASIGLNSDGMLAAIPLVGDDPLTRLAVNCHVDIPATGKTYDTGDRASAVLLRPVSEIESTVRIAGRADALLLEAANALHIADAHRRACVLPTDDDSAMELVENGIVPMAAVSTVDAETGEWNLPLCERHGAEGLAVVAFAVKDGARIDLVTSLEAMKDAGVKAFLQTLQTETFCGIAAKHTEYDCTQTGTVRKIWMIWG